MALLFFLSSTGFSVDSHYCKDQLKSISFFGKAKSCHEISTKPSCHHLQNACTPQKKDRFQKTDKHKCCHNKTFVIKRTDLDAVTPQWGMMPLIQFHLVVAFMGNDTSNFAVWNDFRPYAQYKPPLPDRVLRILYQTFLI